MSWWILWLALAAALVAAEVHTQTLYALFLAVGALLALVLAAVGLPFWLQVSVAGVAGAAGLVAVRPVAARLMQERRTAPYRFPGMAGGLVGQRAITTDTVGDEHHPGHAVLGGERWLAMTDAADPLPAQTEVVVAAVRGTTLLVRADSAPHLP
jgi:membrane protein implicated in regulation of membrane protease activity